MSEGRADPPKTPATSPPQQAQELPEVKTLAEIPVDSRMGEGAEPDASHDAARARRAHRQLAFSDAMGVAAAVVIALVVNVLGARHYWRWDVTSESLYTLSKTTEHTLAGLSEPVEIWVLLSESDPQSLTLRHLLAAYSSQSSQLRVRFVDPDRSPAELFAAQQRFGIVAGKSEGGQVVTDAAIVVARGKRRHFVTSSELVSVEPGEELRVRPEVERMLTTALGEVLRGEPVDVCFTSGHGEPDLDTGGDDGLLPLRGRLEKANFAVRALPSAEALEGRDSISECELVVIAGPRQRLSKREIERLEAYLGSGGNFLIAAGPVPDEAARGFVGLGLDPLLGAAGLMQRQDLVFERAPAMRASAAQGELFFVKLAPHPITLGLVAAGGENGVAMLEASSLSVLPNARVVPEPLALTSDESFGMRDVFAWAESGASPEPTDGDVRGPLTLAYAAELPKLRTGAEHGSRIVVLGTASLLHGRNWRGRDLALGALFVEGAVSWLAAKTVVLDIPAKSARLSGLKITEEALATVLFGVVLVLPMASLFAGVFVRWRRGASEARGRRGPAERRPGKREKRDEREPAKREKRDEEQVS
ncbi:MAG: hypothetical protein EXR75_14885 [Myxococcales bacterium]|nr:hypothetical protein [Myxococcales bacterium]